MGLNKLTDIFENSVPNKMNKTRGSKLIMSFGEYQHQVRVSTNNQKNGNKGRTASFMGRIFPVRFLYDLMGIKHKNADKFKKPC